MINYNLFYWNEFIHSAWSIIDAQNLSVFILLETRSDDHRAREVMQQLRFHDFRVVPPTDKRGGVWLFWKNTIDLILFSSAENMFHVLFKFHNIKPEVLFTGIHAPSVPAPRHRLWRSMEENLPPPETPWLVVGDMNEVTSQADKKGGRLFRRGQCSDLNNLMDAAGLMDLGYSGCPYTWTNAREGAELIMERLDKALANPPLLDAFPHIKVHHLPRIHSDHCPIIVSLDNPILKDPFPFRCKEVWMEHPNFKNFFTSNWLSVNTDFLIGVIIF